MFNGGSRKRLASPPPAGVKDRGTDAAAHRGGDRRDDESVGRTKRQRVSEDGGRVVTAPALSVNRPANCLLRPSGFYLQPSYPALPGPRTSCSSSTQPPHHPYSHHHHPPAALPAPASMQSSSTACVPYYDVLRMQMLAAAAASGDVWKARAAAAAAAAVTGVCPLTPPLNMIWPPTAPSADFLSAVGRPRNPLEQFLAMSPPSVGHYRQLNQQRALTTLDDVKPPRDSHYRQGRTPPPVPAEVRKPFSAFRLVADVDDAPVISAGSSSLSQIDHDDDSIDVTNQDECSHVDDASGHRLDDNANRCDADDAPLCDDKQNDTRRLADADCTSQQQNTHEVSTANACTPCQCAVEPE